jgi:hypothetical protein
MKKLLFLLLLMLCGRIIAQVNLQTGGSTFSIPMFSWQDEKSRLNTVVALGYNSGNGLRVNDVASNIGQGWNLTAGGVITRMQIGEPDDQPGYDGNGTIEDITKYPAGYLYNTNDASKGVPKALTRYPIFGDENHLYKQHNTVAADRELDYFSFQFNGVNGLFILDKNSANQGVFLSDNHMKVWFTRDENLPAAHQVNQGIRTTINAFYIQDENGLIYRFANYATTKILKTGYCDENLVQDQNAPRFKGGDVYHESSFDKGDLINPYVINSWFLTDITDPFTQRKISFTYTTRSFNTLAGMGLSYYSKGYGIISHHKSVATTQAISSIGYPDGHTVYFNYGNDRFDFIGDKCLSSVDIMYNGRYLSRYQLTQSYFIKNRYGTPVSDYQKSMARLCLLSVKQIGVDMKADYEPYLFDYYMGSSATDDFVPAPFTYLRDIWGYYNGSNSHGAAPSETVDINASVNTLNSNQIAGLCFIRDNATSPILNPKIGYAKNGLLKQVIYPTGGTLNYFYDQNTGVLNNQSTYIGGVHVSKTQTTDGGYQNGCDNPIITTYNYVDNSGNSSLWGLEMPVNSVTTSNHYAPEYKYYHYSFPFGSCGYHYQYPGISSREERPDISWIQETMQNIAPYMNIINVITTIMDVANALGPESGPGAAITVVIDIIAGLVDVGLTCFSNTVSDPVSTVYYNSDLNASNPLPVQFKRVEVVPNTGPIGKTVEEFTSSDDYAIWEPISPALTTMSMKQRFAPWAYGLPKKVTVYDVNGNKIKETENIYDTSNARRSFVFGKHPASYKAYPSCKSLILRSYSQRNTDWSNVTLYDAADSYMTSDYFGGDGIKAMLVEMYDVYAGRTQLSDTYERVFKNANSSQYVETQIHYDYNYYNYRVAQITTTQSNGDINYKNISYNCDYNDGGVLNALKVNNVLSVPVASLYSVKKTGNNVLQYLGESVTEYAAVANGDIKPVRTLEQRFAQPVSSIQAYVPNNASNSSIYKQTQTFQYDGYSNLIGLKDEGNHVIANIYDYNDKYVVASVINAEANTDHPAYTSFETQNYFGGWSGSGTINSSNYVTTGGVTGSTAFILNGASLSANINSGKAYKLSFWANSGINVSGNATLIKYAPTINGFTYYEYDIAQGTTSVSVSGNATIDELRLYPAMARMRTVSYDPLIGKTSECDENNRITYYEYDELGRLKLLKDENRNIVKMYEYNTVSNKQSGCPTVYYNNYITETFTKENCQSGYTGGNITYSIPANKYSSNRSQLEADKQAENEINALGQAYANNNGACLQLFRNAAVSRDFTKKRCPAGYKGLTITYSVPEGKYTSTKGQAYVDSLALAEITANGYTYANTSTTGCVINTDPVWEADESAQTQCGSGSLAGHLIALMTDVNPNSSSYGTTQWQDAGEDNNTCPITNANVLLTNNNMSIYYLQVYIVNANNPSDSYTFDVNNADSKADALIGSLPIGVYNVYLSASTNNVSFFGTELDTDCCNYSSYSSGTQVFYNISIGSSGLIITTY